MFVTAGHARRTPDPLDGWDTPAALPDEGPTVVTTAAEVAQLVAVRWYDSDTEAIAAADADLPPSGQVIAVVEDLNGEGFTPHVVDLAPSRSGWEDLPGWVCAVRTFEGAWVRFGSYDHATEFLTVEVGLVQARRRLVQAGQRAAADPAGRWLEAASQWARVLAVYRNERDALLPLE